MSEQAHDWHERMATTDTSEGGNCLTEADYLRRRALTANFIIVTCAPEYVLIRDIGPWTQRPTVTNDAEGVVRRLARAGYLPRGRRLFYFDSENCMDEIVVKNGEFAGFMVLR